MSEPLLTQYYRCPPEFGEFQLSGALSEEAGFFRFGPELICYGRSATGYRSLEPSGTLYDASTDVVQNEHGTQLPFDPSEVVTNFYYERYTEKSRIQTRIGRVVRDAYYFLRPLLAVSVRNRLQRFHLKDWRKLSFPHWPVDTTVDGLMEALMAISIKQQEAATLPFIWFWPEGKEGCAIVTHDVETQRGVDLSPWLMDTDRSFDIPASFQIVPEERYSVSETYLEKIRSCGFEVNVQDLNHDGHLYRSRRCFKKRAAKINQYGKLYGAAGFRAGVLYRNQDWYDLLDFDYDTSIPNVAHLDPQRGGCCTVMPYFIGRLVELPVTMTQDYSLFHIVNDYSLRIWEQQINLILQRHGLINVITHPDYITGPRQKEIYVGLLSLLARSRRERNVWVALGKDVSTWWRQRSQMQLVRKNGDWCVEGPGSERAVVAHASLEDDLLRYDKGCAVYS